MSDVRPVALQRLRHVFKVRFFWLGSAIHSGRHENSLWAAYGLASYGHRHAKATTGARKATRSFLPILINLPKLLCCNAASHISHSQRLRGAA